MVAELGRMTSLDSNLLQVWNKCDLLPEGAAAEAGQQEAPGAADEQRQEQEEGDQQQQQQQPQKRRKQQEPAATTPPLDSSSLGSPEGSSGCGGLQAAAAAGLLPPAVQALLDGDAGAAGYRPTAVATSVLRRQGLQGVLAAVEHKASEGLVSWSSSKVAWFSSREATDFKTFQIKHEIFCHFNEVRKATTPVS